jgi:hypothetical protein
MPDLASTSPYIRASEKFPKLKQQAAERLEKCSGHAIEAVETRAPNGKAKQRP